jgi:hypothetical protein
MFITPKVVDRATIARVSEENERRLRPAPDKGRVP